jgi:serine/threonine-protein kinase HipA
MTTAIEVRIWGQRVGAVAADPRLGAYVFGYDKKWLSRGIELAPRMMPVATYKPPGHSFPLLSKDSFHGLPGLLSDALPDSFGNALIDAWMATHGVDRASITTLDRLAYMGKRGLGALEFKPSKGAARESQDALQMQALVETARAVVHGNLADDRMAKAALTQIIRVGTSAGGARAKAVIAWNPDTHEIRSGQFAVAPGFEHWLLKFDGVGMDFELGTGAHYGRVEYAYHLMATAAGIAMSPCRLLHENGRAHFMTRRFDREENKKHHVQTLCAMAHLDYKQRGTHAYAQAFMTLASLKLPIEASDQLFLRMAFNVMARNCDDHTKNFAFRMKDGAQWELSPAYDVTHAYNPKGEWTYQHLMSVNDKFDGITRADLLTEASRFNVRAPERLIDDVAAALDSWPQFAAEAGLDDKYRDLIAADFRPMKR